MGVLVGEDFTVASENGFRLDATGLRSEQAAICYQHSSDVKLAILDASSDRFDIRRTDHPRMHLVFGRGPHRCMDEYLARLDMQEGLAALLSAGPQIGKASAVRLSELKLLSMSS